MGGQRAVERGDDSPRGGAAIARSNGSDYRDNWAFRRDNARSPVIRPLGVRPHRSATRRGLRQVNGRVAAGYILERNSPGGGNLAVKFTRWVQSDIGKPARLVRLNVHIARPPLNRLGDSRLSSGCRM